MKLRDCKLSYQILVNKNFQLAEEKMFSIVREYKV